MDAQWTQALAIETLKKQRQTTFRQENKQIALFWTEEQVFAVDNRCPHQGYPLKEGTLEEGSCVLTCQWHNWKFDIKTGRCIQGEDHVRTYPTRLQDGFVWLDLSEPSQDVLRASMMEGLRAAVEKQQFGRLCRELVRFSTKGFDPTEALREVLAWRSDRFEYGMTHAHAVSADWMELYDESQGDQERQILCIAEAIDHLAYDSVRHPVYPFAEGTETFDGSAFLDAIEREDEAQVIRLLRGGHEAGMSWAEFEPWMVRAALAHYNDFGHALIFVQKTGALIARLGPEVMMPLLLPLARSLCMSTREDLLPMFRRYPAFFSEAPIPKTFDFEGHGMSEETRSHLWDANVNQAMAWVNEQLQHHRVESLYNVLLEASARALLFYDSQYQEAFDKPVAQHIGWLHFTHALTFAHAVRWACSRYPELWPAALLQMACFAGRHQAFQDRTQPVESWFVDDAKAFFETELERVCDHGVLPPIFSSHLLKILLAVREEAGRLEHLMEQAGDTRPQLESCHRYLLASCHRFLHAPIKQKHVRRAIRQAFSLVE